jgi:two-component system CheB/CheR fusion protein
MAARKPKAPRRRRLPSPLEPGVDQARAIVEAVRQPLVVLDADFRVVTANRSFFATFQIRPEEAERQSFFALGNRQWNVPQLRTMLKAVLTESRVFEDLEVEHDFERIGKRTMHLNGRRVPLATGQSPLILLAIDDVTEPKRIEHERADRLTRERRVRAEAETALLARDKFLAILAHELRTPLNSMLGWTRMLRTHKLDDASVADALEVIERNTLLQVRLIEDLLDISRIGSGTMRLERRPILVAPVVRGTLVTMQPAAEAKGVVLNSVVDDDTGPVWGDPARLQQVVWNLVSNGIKFTPSGGRVEVRVARRGAAVEITVLDTGRGMATEQLRDVFNRFGVTHTSTQSQGGMGLGLSIARHLVELHGGTVHAESPGPGHGATFTVTLPLTDEALPGEAASVGIAATGLVGGGLPALDGLRILVVDDEADGRELLRATLARCGAEVTVVASARAAREALERAPFDVLVSDIVMPDEDGYSLIRQVRAREAERGGGIPALALTAYARFEDRTAAISAGYQQHAAKPIEPAELAAAVATLAGRGERTRGA